MQNNPETTKLINEFCAGNTDRFTELYESTVKYAYRIAWTLLDNSEDVRDVIQNSYIKVYAGLPELKNPDSFFTWLRVIIENESKNYIKKHTAIALRDRNDKVDNIFRGLDDEVLPDEVVDFDETRRLVERIVAALPKDKQICIRLYYYEQIEVSEIAEALGVPIGTVKSRLYSARKTIEKELKKNNKTDSSLYSFGPIPILLAVLKYQTQQLVVPASIESGGVSIAAVASAQSAYAASAAAATVASTGIGAVSGTAAATAAVVAPKVVAVLTAVTVTAGGATAVKSLVNHDKANSPGESTSYQTEIIEQQQLETANAFTVPHTTEPVTVYYAAAAATAVEKASASERARTTVITREYKKATAARTSVAHTTVKPTTAAQTVISTRRTIARNFTTTSPSTSPHTATSAKSTTTTPTQRAATTTKATTTTSAQENYSASGGIITDYTGSNSTVSIPSSINGSAVTAIGSGAFADNTDITSVALPSSVTKIGQEAFSGCSSLTQISMPTSLKSVGIASFYGCTALSSVTLPSGTQSIGDEAFSECAALKSVTIPDSVTSIGDSAFDGCDDLTIKCSEGSAAYEYALANSINVSV